MTQWGPPVYKIALRALSFSAVWAVHSIDKDWCRMIVELPHRYGGLGLTPLPASGLAAFYSATARLVSWLGSLPQSHSSHWVCDQDLAECNTWTSSPSAPSTWCTLNSLRTTDALSGPPAANAADDEQQRDDDNDRPSRTPRITGRGPWTITVSD